MHRNASHSCVSVPLDSHFEGRPRLRELFDELVAACTEHVAVRIVSSKTRIALMDRVRFASVMTRKIGLGGTHNWVDLRKRLMVVQFRAETERPAKGKRP